MSLPSRDDLGRRVREVWVNWAKSQPSPKASWLVSYDELIEADKEADRMIGEALWYDGFERGGKSVTSIYEKMIESAKEDAYDRGYSRGYEVARNLYDDMIP